MGCKVACRGSSKGRQTASIRCPEWYLPTWMLAGNQLTTQLTKCDLPFGRLVGKQLSRQLMWAAPDQLI